MAQLYGTDRANLYFKEQSRRILDNILDRFQERDSFATVDDSVIVGQSQVHHRSDHDLTVQSDRPFLNRVQSEDT